MKSYLALGSSCLAAVLVSAATSPALALTPTEGASVLYMKQEEKMARDLYQALALRWDLTVFKNIAASEQRHMSAIDNLIVAYGLTDSAPSEAGKFTIPELQTLHDQLLAQGGQSIEAALRVGVLVEEADIADLKEAIGATTEPMILRVYGNLLRGSGNHLVAFHTALESGDTSTLCPGQGQGSCGNGKACANGSGAGNGRQGMRQGNQGRGANGCMKGANGTQAASCNALNCPSACPSAPSTTPPTTANGGRRNGR
ncbi:MAG: DUF2202 domain-containing protein [Verrucomicrobiales bacterium]|nr:DUF2202 domain-containing protein [Verrucomicrobiales bacterium]